jgi:alpha-N-arabinofuranosidase
MGIRKRLFRFLFYLGAVGFRLLMEPLDLLKVNKKGPKNPEPTGAPLSLAELTIDAKIIKGEIDPFIYGGFIEVLGQCIYGGIWDEANKKVPLLHGGLRTDVLEEIRALRVPIIRWPGGCFSDVYHWKDGIGPRTQRKTKRNRHWGWYGPKIGPKDNNHFGSDEFMLFIKEVSTEPYININFGSGTKEEAAQWVEYMNGDKTTEYGALRAQNGNPDPYNVNYWGIANEIFGDWEVGSCSAEEYATQYLEFANAMRARDPSIKFIAVGVDFTMPDWNRTLLKIAGKQIDYLSLHVYVPGTFLAKVANNVQNFYYIIAGAFEVERRIQWFEESIANVLGNEKKIPIALDEWNVWWNMRQLYEGYFTLRDGLFAASVFEVLHRHTETVKMANLAQLVNVIPAIVTNETDVYHNPIYLALQLFSTYAEKYVTSFSINCEKRYNPSFGNIAETEIPYLGCSVTTNDAKDKLVIIGINRHHAQDLTTRISLSNFDLLPTAKVLEMNGPSHSAYNSFEKKEEVNIRVKESISVSNQFTYTFPAHSITVIILQKKST